MRWNPDRSLPRGPLLLTLSALLAPPSLHADPISPPRLAREVARAASPDGAAPLSVDPSLARAAERHLDEILKDERHARWTRIQAALAREGLADAQVVPFATFGADPSALAANLQTFTRETVQIRGMTHVGLALARSERAETGRPPVYGLLAIFSRRLVELAPLPRTPRSTTLTLRGRSPSALPLEALFERPCLDARDAARRSPCTEISRLPLTSRGTRFTLSLPFDRGPGRYTIEILADRDRGPEIAALWRFYVGRAPTEDETSRASASEEANDEGALLSVVNEARRAADLGPLDRSEPLDRAARDHARSVCRTMIAAHILPGGSGPSERVRQAGFLGSTRENIAIADSISRAHENLLASPSHRMNLLDPTARWVGVGVVERRSNDEPERAHDGPGQGERATYCIVELFAGGDDPWGRPEVFHPER